MVDILEVQTAAYRMAKIGTSGYDATPEFLGKANEVNIDMMNLLTPHYGKIQAADDLLDMFVKEIAPVFVSGVWQKPADYYGFISMNKTDSGNTIPVRKLATNAVGATQQNSIRRRTTTKPGYYFRNNAMILVPSNGDAGLSTLYFRLPANVDLKTSAVSTETDDYLTVTSQTNYEWAPRCKNLIIYLLVQRLGVEMKEPILQEVSQLGISQNLTVQSDNK